MASYNFSLPGHCMSFISKLRKHRNDPRRLVDYILVAFDTTDPTHPKEHPMWEHLEEAIAVCKQYGWQFRTMSWKDQGIQAVAISPEEGYYHSKFQHSH